MNVHTVQYFNNTRTGLTAAQCSCGWYASGTLRAVQSRALSHHTDDGGKDEKTANHGK